ncbi:hypothetical protein [Flavobacterium sp. N1719]|uniref:hypothetical protein n=1 Tax=Flavobacterium sp. N1719 TaxID=2885633 RepID=UPI002222B870|nr:hypothetical protein [Flavobacterium sp. N1719]
MKKVWNWYRSVSAMLLIVLSFGIGLLSKLVEIKFEDLAMGLQLIAFFFLISGLIRFFDKTVFK